MFPRQTVYACVACDYNNNNNNNTMPTDLYFVSDHAVPKLVELLIHRLVQASQREREIKKKSEGGR